ncbi:MAG: squalene/phytoene synthase family protein [Qingshengfaniella sp.]
MTLAACAELVERGDPDRWLTVLAVPPEARCRLLPVYAFNVEVSRAPWAVSEPMIAEMRLQWWADALAEIADGGRPRDHEVCHALAGVLDVESIAILADLVDARRQDAWPGPFADLDALKAYLDATGGGLMRVACRALGADDVAAVRAQGRAAAAAAWLAAVPALIGAGRHPLPGDPGVAIRGLAEWGLDAAETARAARRSVAVAARPALLAGWMAAPVLARALNDPARVLDGRLGHSEARRKARLIRMRYLGRW